ncbi:MAG: hypothetical protein IJ391_07745 [Clostridia bacterium]|nr:hypothetical protein [Clostridia bacterium]
MSIVIRMSQLNIEIDTQSEYIKKKCSDYLTDSADIDMSVKVTREEIEHEKALSPGYTDDYYEFVCVYRAICMKMPLYDRLLVHSAVIDTDGRGYAFAAKSGVGKTTHIRMWKQAFGDSVSIINGDKPIYRFENGRIYACGTPWCGKEGYNINRETELKAICFINRGEENKLQKIEPGKASDLVFGQIIMPKSADAAIKTLELCSSLLKHVPVYNLWCDISTDAAHTAKKVLELA